VTGGRQKGRHEVRHAESIKAGKRACSQTSGQSTPYSQERPGAGTLWDRSPGRDAPGGLSQSGPQRHQACKQHSWSRDWLPSTACKNKMNGFEEAGRRRCPDSGYVDLNGMRDWRSARTSHQPCAAKSSFIQSPGESDFAIRLVRGHNVHENAMAGRCVRCQETATSRQRNCAAN